MLKSIVTEMFQPELERRWDEALGGEKSERTEGRVGPISLSRSTFDHAGEQHRVAGCLRTGRAGSEPRQSSGISAPIYVRVSTRKVKALTEELCGQEFIYGSNRRIVAASDEELEEFSRRRLEEHYPYLILYARGEK